MGGCLRLTVAASGPPHHQQVVRSVEVGKSWLQIDHCDVAVERASEHSVLDLDLWVLDSDRWVRWVEQYGLSLLVVVVVDNGLELLGVDAGVDVIVALVAIEDW